MGKSRLVDIEVEVDTGAVEKLVVDSERAMEFIGRARLYAG